MLFQDGSDYNESNPVSLTKDGPNMKAREEMRARYRARLVAQGYRQRANDSYDPDHISSPVVHKESLRLFLALSAHLHLRVHQADVKAAFFFRRL